MNTVHRIMAHDVRAIANFVLDLAKAESCSVSNLVINKVVFFVHANYLVEFGEPLVSAKVEAWEYGPVFRELYKEFRGFGDQPISKYAERLSAETGKRERCLYSLTADEREFLEAVTRKYIRLSPSALVALSHEKGGPWDQVWNHVTSTNATMSISNDLISTWYERAARH
jgi:uncharacterized phage-associated protein